MVKKSFRQFDKSGRGEISAGDMIEILEDQGLAKEQCEQIADQADADNNGTVTFEEYEQMMDKAKDMMAAKAA
jgi:Ca2+-binding EF-hand superfamily protein